MEEGLLRTGGENAAQFAEYYRSKRLSEAVNRQYHRREPDPMVVGRGRGDGRFTAWLRARDADQPKDIDELATELADSWCLNNIDAVFTACSPHRVALCVLHLRNFYLEDFADSWWPCCPTGPAGWPSATPPHQKLADRCLPYAQGEPHPEITIKGAGPDPDYLARITE